MREFTPIGSIDINDLRAKNYAYQKYGAIHASAPAPNNAIIAIINTIDNNIVNLFMLDLKK